MNKKAKTLLGIVVIIFVVAVALLLSNLDMGNSSDTATKPEQTATTAEQMKEETTLDDKEYPTVPEHTEDAKAPSTNYFENIDIVEETTKKSKKKKKNKETEAYAGEEDGWSPLVSPDDLEQ